MTLLVQKFGGTSVGSVAHIQRVAQIIQVSLKRGDAVVAVVSAMADETDRLIQLAQQLNPSPNDREYSALLASGEQVTATLLTIALQQLGIKAKSYNAFQMQLQTDGQYCKARILNVDWQCLQEDLDQHIVPVVMGFQGVNAQQEITTLGRGGSDISAVALAAFMHAEECQIFTDVDGVYSADPHIVTDAQRIKSMSYDEMLTYAQLGANVLQQSAVEMARKYNVILRVLSSLQVGPGTLITRGLQSDKLLVSGVACEINQVKASMTNLVQTDVTRILNFIEQERIDMDMFWQQQIDGAIKLSFVMNEGELATLCKFTSDIHVQSGMAKLSLVGQRMRTHAGFSAHIMQLLGQQNIQIHRIVSSETKVSILIDSAVMQHAAVLLHKYFKTSNVRSREYVINRE